MIQVRTTSEIACLRDCGKINAQVHERVREAIRPGITTKEMDDIAQQCMLEHGAVSSLQSVEGFPGHVCVSVNDEVGHGVPGSYRIQEGDLVKLDVSVNYKGLHTDCARTYPVGKVSSAATNLVNVTAAALQSGVSCAYSGRCCSDISNAVYKTVVSYGYEVVRHAFGHGIGEELHEPPQIASFGPANLGPRLRPGMVIAIEPVVTVSSRHTRKKADGWTDMTGDGSLSAHFEDTLLITNGPPELLTLAKREQAGGRRNLLGVFGEENLEGIVFRPPEDSEKKLLLEMVAAEMDPVLLEAWGRRVNPYEIFDPAGTAVVLKLNGSIVGFYLFSQAEERLHLNTVVIRGDFQGRGLGRLVMEKLNDTAKELGLSQLSLCVQTNNLRAVKFYQNLGFANRGVPFANTFLMDKKVE